MNPLNEYPRIRKAVYAVQWVVSGVLGATGVTANRNVTGNDATGVPIKEVENVEPR